MKKYAPLALSAAALAAVIWWAAATVGGDDAPEARRDSLVPTLSPEPGVPRSDKEPTTALVDVPPPPITQSKPPPVTVPDKIVPRSEPAAVETGTLTPPSGTRRPAREIVKRKPRAAGRFEWGTFGFRFLPGPGQSALAPRSTRVRAGKAIIGSAQREVDAVGASGPSGRYAGLSFEVPRHTVEFDRFWIDRWEITNQRYWEYLHHSARVLYDTREFPGRTLVEIATELVQPAPANLDIQITARQLYEANRDVLLSVLKDEVVREGSDVNDERTWQRVSKRVVPRGLRLEFFERAPPEHWPRDRFAEHEADHPVRGISLEEAIEFAMWTGRHIPTEQQWEYAARGPKGRAYPWGDRRGNFRQRVNGGRVLREGQEPETVPAHHLAEGASWVGCLNMLGNVSEWTSSWDDPYPGAEAVVGAFAGNGLVVRGGSAADQDPNLVRVAFRGYNAEDPAGAPRPNVRRPWTGFRTARYEDPGRPRIHAMEYFARRGGLLDPAVFPDAPTFEGWFGILVLSHDRFFDPEDPEIRPGVKSFTARPLKAAAFQGQPGTGRMTTQHGQIQPPPAGRPFVLGLFENGIKLVSTWQASLDGPGALSPPRRFKRVDCPPGVWLVGTLHDHVVLMRPDFQQVFYTNPRGRLVERIFSVRERTPPSNPERARSTVSLRFDAHSGNSDLRFEVPMGPPGTPGYAHLARLRVKVKAELQDVARVTRWGSGSLR